jgi:single-strand DNA-binding protein
LRTRKWQDQNGNDRYSTEVNVGGMNGTLTMLDGASGSGSGSGGGGGSRGGDYDQSGGSFGGGKPAAKSGGGWQQGGGSDGYDDLDDDIPF